MSRPVTRSFGFRLALAALGLGAFAARGCTPAQETQHRPDRVLVVGVDVSGSFRGTGHHDDALEFLSHYLYGHLEGVNGLEKPTALFVGPVGGDRPDQARAFHPIHDFRGKTREEIAADLRSWFEGEDRLTDYNAFFRRVSEVMKQRGLALAPTNIVVISDGVPDLTASPAGRSAARTAGSSAGGAEQGPAAPTSAASAELYDGIDFGPLEYLSHSVTVRLLYPEPEVAAAWERHVTRHRVRVWTTDATVMSGWKGQVREGVPPEKQERLWTWVRDNVDHPVRGRLF